MNPQSEWFEKDYYSVLGVSKGASAKEINKSYRKLARELHPDVNPGDDAAEDRFKEVTAAYEVLDDESKRAEYDEVRAMAASGGGFGGCRRALQLLAQDDSPELKAELLADLDEAIVEYKSLWLARNRPGGLNDSVAHFDSLLAAYRE